MGKVTYEIQKAEEMRVSAYIAEIDLSKLEKYYENTPAFTPIPAFAEEARDLALVMDKNVTCQEVEDVITSACRFVSDVKLFDVYEGAQLGDSKRSMAFTLTFTPAEEEFTSEALDGYVHKILKNLNNKLGIELRS